MSSHLRIHTLSTSKSLLCNYSFLMDNRKWHFINNGSEQSQVFAIQIDIKLLMFGSYEPDRNEPAFKSVIMPVKFQKTLIVVH